jgi:hypothetical protein
VGCGLAKEWIEAGRLKYSRAHKALGEMLLVRPIEDGGRRGPSDGWWSSEVSWSVPGGRGLSGSSCPHEMRQGGGHAHVVLSGPHDTVVGGAKARGRARVGGGDWSGQ